MSLKQRLVSFIRRSSRKDAVAVDSIATDEPIGDLDYQARAAREAEFFSDYVNVHDLPDIFHYWSNKFLRPDLEAFGYSHPEDFYAKAMLEQARKTGRPLRVISLGSGNCDAEVRIAKALIDGGLSDFRLDCLDLTPAMLARGKSLAEENGLEKNLGFVQGDFNRWRAADGAYDVVLANQSLHHVSDLEHLYDAISAAIGNDGIFVTCDIIGRNGHQRWPEALAIVLEFWDELPARYHYNAQLKRQEHVYPDWDCSTEGFEGIRAQDVLPLAIEKFGFKFFLAFANVTSPFVDRTYGHNFSLENPWDVAFIDRLHARDDAEILAGRIKPTTMLAIMCNDRSVVPRVKAHLTPEFCMRVPDA